MFLKWIYVPPKPDLLFSNKSVVAMMAVIFFPKNFKFSFSGLPLKDFPLLFCFFLSNIFCEQFLPAYKNSWKWNPWVCLWNAFFSKTNCHGSYLEPISFCFRAEWCTFPSIFLTQIQKPASLLNISRPRQFVSDLYLFRIFCSTNSPPEASLEFPEWVLSMLKPLAWP